MILQLCGVTFSAKPLRKPAVKLFLTYRGPYLPPRESAPPPTPGCEGVMRQWDRAHRRWTARILPGEAYVTCHDEFISAVVGSSIAVCIRDPVARVGGMRLVLLPANGAQTKQAWGMKADLEALCQCHRELESLVGELTTIGASRERLKARIFGGMRRSQAATEAIAKTIVCVRQFMREHGVPVVGEALGDTYPRLVSFSPATGTAEVKRLPSRYAFSVANKEMEHFNKLGAAPAAVVQSRAS